jgi:hypothetical protein
MENQGEQWRDRLEAQGWKAAVALYFWSYNFCLIHGSLRMTPAMAAGITNRIWELSELI